MKQIIIFICLLIGIPLIVEGQTSIKGRIVDSNSGNGLQGASVIIKGTGTGTSTGQDGYFVIEPGQDTHPVLQISFMGYRYLEINYTREENELVIYLDPLAEIIDMVVVTATRGRRNLTGVPLRIGLIDVEDIEQVPALSADDLLRPVPGILVSRVASIFGSATVSMRGTGKEAGRTLVMIDGVPLNQSDGGNINWNSIDTDQINRIEVVKGAGSSIHGGNAMGGVINLITGHPKSGFEGYASQGYGSFNTMDTRAGIGGRQEDMLWQINGMFRDSDGYITTPADEIDNFSAPSFLGEYRAGGKAGYYIGPDQLLEISGSFYGGQRGTGSNFKGYGFVNDEIAADKGALNNYKTINSRISYNGYFENSSHLSLSFYGQSENYQRIRESVRSNVLTRYDVKSIRNDMGFLSAYSIITGAHRISTGIDFRNGSVDGADIYLTSSDQVFNLGKMNQVGVYFQDEISLPGTYWSLLTGIRFDYARFFNGAFYIKNPTNETLFLQDFEKNIEEGKFNAFTHRFSMQYHNPESFRVYGGYSRGYRAPVLDDMSRTGRISGGMKLANPGLKPEYLDNFEIGGDYFIGNSITISSSVFYSSGRDYHGYISTGDSLILNNRLRPIRIMDNISKVSITGIELGAKFQISANFKATLSYSRTTTEINEFRVLDPDIDDDLTGMELVYQPADIFHASLAWRNRFVNIFISFNHTGAQWINDVNTESIEVFTYTDLHMWRDLGWGISTSVKVHNLLDRDFTDSRNMTAPGRMITGELRFRF